MKILISILISIIVFIAVIILDFKFAGWVVEPLHGDVKVVVKITFLLFTGGVVLWFASFLGFIVGALIYDKLNK